MTNLLQKVKIAIFSTIVSLSLLLIPTQDSYATCSGRFLNPITDVCWDCIFPISIGAAEIPPSTMFRPDTENFPSPICVCPNPKFAGAPTPGLAVGFWEPTRMVDVTKNPFCMVSLGGLKVVPEGLSLVGGGIDEGENNATWHLHWYLSPFISILNIFLDVACMEMTTFDLAYLTEFDPLFHDDLLAFIINPEAILFANPIAQAVCVADCIAATSWKPLDPLFWCAGCQASLYPFTGNITGQTNSIQGASMVTEKFIAKLHRQLMLWDTSGPEAICSPLPAPIIKKSQYRIQTTIPVPGMGPYGCTPFGRSTFLHEAGKEIPITGEDFGFLVWRKRNCCVQ